MASVIRSVHDTYRQLRESYAIISATFAPMRLSRTELLVIFAKQTWLQLPRAAQITLVGLLLLVLAYVVDALVCRLTSLRRLGIPLVKIPRGLGKYSYHKVFQEASRKYHDRPYLYRDHSYEYVVYPASCFDEVKRLPREQASTIAYFTKVFFSGWPFLGNDTNAIHKSIGTDLSRALPVRVHARQEETARAVRDCLGPFEAGKDGGGPSQWKSLPLYWTALSITVLANAQGLVGPQLGTDRRWLLSAKAFPVALGIGTIVSQAFPRWTLRPLVALVAYLPAWLAYAYMSHLLKPLATAAAASFLATGGDETRRRRLLAASGDKPFPVAAWLMSRYPPPERLARSIVHDLIVLTFEATPALSTALYEQLLELAQRPALADELRQEVAAVSDQDGRLPPTQLHELAKMDSFMRELSRWSPSNSLVLFRTLLRPTQLSVGPRLPAGATVAVDAFDIHASPARWADPQAFDPLRFLKLRGQPGNETRYLYSATGADSPNWGDGTQACPGRVFATNTLKIVLSYVLMHYDLRMVPGQGRPVRPSMPNGIFAPNMLVRIEFRERGTKAQPWGV